jgi:acetyl esterase/lipase
MRSPAPLVALGLLALVPCAVAVPVSAAEGKRPRAAGKEPAPTLTRLAVPHEDRRYKTTPQGDLSLHFSLPAEWRPTDSRPAIVLFFGGGWKGGSARQFAPQCDYFASRGMVAAAADYRIKSVHGTAPDACVEDAKSAVRWLRGHARELGIDPDRIAAGGGSAGGHLAACTALVDGFDAEAEDRAISSRPNALVLFNPGLNIDELAANRDIGLDAKLAAAITPNRFIKAGAPPAIIFFGTDDPMLVGAERYVAKARPLGVRVELWTASGQPHGFFNRSPWIEATARQADLFLASLGYLDGPPTVDAPAGSELRSADPPE